MNEIQKAYRVLGLEPGTALDLIKKRYRQLAMVWHPDRMANSSAKIAAEEELKKINHSFDILRKHFEKHHRPSGPCDCRAEPSQAETNGAYERRRREEEAQRKDEERRREEQEARQKEAEARRRAEQARHAAEESALRAAAEAAQRAASMEAENLKTAVSHQEKLKDEELRRKLSMLAGAAFLVLIAFGWLGVSARATVNNVVQEWNRRNDQPAPKTPPQSKPKTSFRSPYIPPYERFPGGNPSSWRQHHDEQEKRRKSEEEEKRRQEIFFARLQLDRAQKTINYCSHDIAQIDIKLANPYLADSEKTRLKQTREFQQRNLAQAIEELEAAATRLADLGAPDVKRYQPKL